MSMFARLLPLPAAAPGLRSRFALLLSPAPVFVLRFGGREETQSCTRRDTFGLLRRLRVFLEVGFVVMMILGPGGRFCVEVGGNSEIDGEEVWAGR